MSKIAIIILASVSVMVPVLARQSDQDQPANEPAVRFSPLHIYIDSGSRSLAAYQFELVCSVSVRAYSPGQDNASRRHYERQIKIVGVEGGEHKAFQEAPYYDPAALAKDRIIIASFNTGKELPKERTRIATIHLQIIGDVEPEYNLMLTVVADENGEEIPAKISYEKGEKR